MMDDDDPGVGWTPEESDGKRDWPSILAVGAIAAVVFIVLLALLWPWLP